MLLSGQELPSGKNCTPCAKLKDLKLPDVTILTAESMASDTIKGEGWLPTVVVKVPYCRLLGKISKEINFELLVPLDWNGRFLMSGNGGFAGSFQNVLRNYINEGYAIGATDTGHQGIEVQADWALNNMERQLNFGKLAVHRTVVVSKALLNALHCAYPSYSYFVGCSRGGGQALMEAQVYGDDFNGIVAGAPAFNWPAIGAKFVQGCQQIYPNSEDPTPILTADNLKLLQEFIMSQCDKLDAVADRILNDPRNCKIDLSKLPLCAGNKPGPACFTREQLKAIQTVYDPAVVDGQEVYPGFPVGLEAEDGSWDFWISGTNPFLQKSRSLHFQFGTNMFKYLVFNDPDWDYLRYDFKNFADETRYAAAYLDATQTDYSAFKQSKGKMIIYHGWNDPALSANATIEHYEAAMKKDAGLSSFVRLYLLPGVLHCGGGTGPDNADWVALIRDWVEHDKAPDRIVLSKMQDGKVTMTRPVFPYPASAVYTGKGDTNLEQNFKATGQ
jgi:feruloyl esterase